VRFSCINDPLKPLVRLYPCEFICCSTYTIACHGCPPVQEKLCRISLVALYIPYHSNRER
jgi:hypothetical protein